MKNKKEQKTKRAKRKGPPPVQSFDRKKDSILLKRMRQKHAFEETQRIGKDQDELAQVWDEDLCE